MQSGAAGVLGVLAAFTLALTGAASAGARTVWLCRPGQEPNPCATGLSTTIYSPVLRPLRVVRPRRDRPPRFDCFYVYPTVSDQKGTLASLHVDPEERSIALYQAARYSQVCRVFAPMYHQVTVPALSAGNRENPAELRIPASDVRRAFATYLRRYNHGRGFVLIGHSQGASVLEELIARDIDHRPAVRRRLLSALLLGGNVTVRRGRAVGGSFKHVPACRRATQLGCVVAFSTFDQAAPDGSLFGRTAKPGQEVLCVNPAALLGAAAVDPIFPSAPFAPGTLIAAGIQILNLTQPHPRTAWVSEPGAYRARCANSNGAHVLEISPLGGAQVARSSPDPAWGLHLIDANIELGNLVSLVRREAAVFAGR